MDANMTLENLRKAVSAVSNEADIDALAKTFGLTEQEDRGGPLDQVLGVYTGQIDGKAVKVTHSWYDRCRVFQIQPDGNRVVLEVDGAVLATGSFLDES